jgi:hypothetical protein
MSHKISARFPHLKIGDRLFAVITYHTPNLFLSHYLPKPYFVLEAHITGVRDMPGGAQYYFDTNFALDFTSVFLDIEDAARELIDTVASELGASLPREKVVSLSSQEYRDQARKAEDARKFRAA